MATKGQTIKNKITGEEITWLETSSDTNGESLTMHFSVAPKGKAPVRHIHPEQNEIFEEVIRGTLKVSHDDEMKILRAGESLTVKKGVPHQWWNNSENDYLEMKITMKPALNSEVFFEQLFGLANDDKTKKDGTPKFLQLMTMINSYKIYLAGPPLALQKMLGNTIGRVAAWFGYKSFYEKYRERN